MGSSLKVERQRGTVIATLNRPEQLNALNKELYDELNRLVDVLETDKTARVLVITGAGQKAFCVGADLKERQGMNEKDTLSRLEYVRTIFPRLENLPMPVIAAINGIALGGGLELALSCDLRVADEGATMGLPEVDLAVIPGTGGTQRLPKLVGLPKAMELILLARRLSAKEAFQIGLVNKIVAPAMSLKEALKWAEKMLESGPIAIRQAKRALRAGTGADLETGLTAELNAYRECLYSKDRLEGLKAFAEKRKPTYTGE